MTLRQLLAVWMHIKRYCVREGWKVPAYMPVHPSVCMYVCGALQDWRGNPLTPKKVPSAQR